jgi:8-oxo-dGTP pyrophosphatase MutT (NUDIX family)
MVIRDGTGGPEILLLLRSRKAGFFPSAWVFPGGRVDPADEHVPKKGAIEGLDASQEAFAVAAIRECFEETGVWLGQGHPGDALRSELNARTATLLDEPGLVADLDCLRLWSWWVTPEVEPRRYDTGFFLAVVDRGLVAMHDREEIVDSAWRSVREALEAVEAGELMVAPPTYRTLHELAPYDTVEQAFEAARHRRVRPICPRLEQDGDEWVIVLPGDPSYPHPEPVTGPTRITFRQGRWWQS